MTLVLAFFLTSHSGRNSSKAPDFMEANNASANFILLGKYIGIHFINIAVDRCADIKFLT